MNGEISSDCLIKLTKPARDKICNIIEERWEDIEYCTQKRKEMPNKPHLQLILLDRVLRIIHPTGMRDEIDCTVTIEKHTGFELFNTRSYHNYETWSSGYYLTYKDSNKEIKVHIEDLDDAMNTLAQKLIKEFEIDENHWMLKNTQ